MRYIKKLLLVSATIASTFGAAYATSVPETNSQSGSCHKEYQTSTHIKPRANCSVTITADTGYVLAPGSLTIEVDGHGNTWHDTPQYAYRGEAPLGQLAPTSITIRFGCNNRRGIGRRCIINGHIAAVQIPNE